MKYKKDRGAVINSTSNEQKQEDLLRKEVSPKLYNWSWKVVRLGIQKISVSLSQIILWRAII